MVAIDSLQEKRAEILSFSNRILGTIDHIMKLYQLTPEEFTLLYRLEKEPASKLSELNKLLKDRFGRNKNLFQQVFLKLENHSLIFADHGATSTIRYSLTKKGSLLLQNVQEDLQDYLDDILTETSGEILNKMHPDVIVENGINACKEKSLSEMKGSITC